MTHFLARSRVRISAIFTNTILLLFAVTTNAQTPEQVNKLEGTVNQANAFFGWSIDIDGDTAVVGAHEESHIQGRAGAAYVFRLDGAGNWAFEARLVATDSAGNFDGQYRDNFGHTVAIDGDTVVVGAYRDDSQAGSAYVFTRAGSTWTFEQKLLANDRLPFDRFGGSIAISGDTIFVGSPRDDYDDSNGFENTGSVYRFTRSGSTWTQDQKLHASDRASNPQGNTPQFGNALAISGELLLVAASGDNQGNGAGYVFEKSGSNWVERAKLTASDSVPGDLAGNSVALSRDTAILGAPNGRDNEDVGNKVFVFVRDSDSGGWSQQATLIGSDVAPSFGVDFFGPVDLFGDIAVIGADADDEKGEASGAAYVFKRTDGVWSEIQKFSADDTAANDWFGAKIAMSGDTVLVAAPTYYFSWNGRTGAAYVFDLNSGGTEPGTDVSVQPVPVDENGDPVEDAPAVSLQFDDVAGAGETTVTLTDPSAQELPDGFKLTGLSGGATYFEIKTTAEFNNYVEICIDYSDMAVAGNPSKLKFLHYDEVIGWEDITSSNDTQNMILCGITDSFSLFAIAEIDDPTEVLKALVDMVNGINTKNGIKNALDGKLAAANEALSNANINNDSAALNVVMNAFINSVEAQRGQQISNEDANALISKAQEIAQVL